MKHTILLLLTFLFLTKETSAQQPTKQKEVLLIGTFHFHNPGLDLAKTDKFDVLSQASQAELDNIANKIKAFAPDKLFVEWDYNQGVKLDSLYSLYVDNTYFEYIAKKHPTTSFFKENEIFQLGFRIAKLCNHKKVYAIDVKTVFPFDSLMLSLERANQIALKEKIFSRIKEFEVKDNDNRKKMTLTQLMVAYNEQSLRDLDLGSYISLFNRAGGITDFAGANLVASWYRRNLMMYSLVQKSTTEIDKKIVILLGASHVALFKQFIDLDENLKVVELKEVLEK
ncbi:DUF5694 domain-containing protein [Flavobacterium sp. UBA6135]|uniref:DUF5694 domain-containing protein n=1 Tax=Flavobacterium sp. UBA6135 TaxID=1946553 RepID=UPI0025C2702A|nr:DUF5694 domain-containing protein [Flavobacterium sp. UBA6135]